MLRLLEASLSSCGVLEFSSAFSPHTRPEEVLRTDQFAFSRLEQVGSRPVSSDHTTPRVVEKSRTLFVRTFTKPRTCPICSGSVHGQQRFASEGSRDFLYDLFRQCGPKP